MESNQELYVNTLRNWVSVGNGSGEIVTLLYYTKGHAVKPSNQSDTWDLDEPLITMARRLGWIVVAAPRTTESGVPYLKAMFLDATRRFCNCTFYGYSNGDILYTGGLLSTLHAVQKALDHLGTTMIIGRRTNVNVVSATSTLYLPEDVERTAHRLGKLFGPSGEDYFITSSAAADRHSGFPWHLIADVVIGRPAYDNYLVMSAIKNNVSVVDATISLMAVHQTDFEGNMAGFRSKDANFNWKKTGRFNFRLGFTLSSQYFTNVTSADGAHGEVTIHWRNLSSRYPFSIRRPLPSTQSRTMVSALATATNRPRQSSRGRNRTHISFRSSRSTYL